MVDEALKNHFFNAIKLAKDYKNEYFIFGHLLIEILQNNKIVREFFDKFTRVIEEEFDEQGNVNAVWETGKMELSGVIKDLKDYVTQCAGDWSPDYSPFKNENGKFVDDLEGVEFDNIDEFNEYMKKYYMPEFSYDMTNIEKFLNNDMFVLNSLDLLSRTVFASENGNNVAARQLLDSRMRPRPPTSGE